MTTKKFTCVICGYKTLDSRCEWDICPICFWEDDGFDESDGDKVSSPNGISVLKAQANFIRLGAIDEKSKANVRPPNDDDKRDPNWKPMKRALELANDGTS